MGQWMPHPSKTMLKGTYHTRNSTTTTTGFSITSIPEFNHLKKKLNSEKERVENSSQHSLGVKVFKPDMISIRTSFGSSWLF